MSKQTLIDSLPVALESIDGFMSWMQQLNQYGAKEAVAANKGFGPDDRQALVREIFSQIRLTEIQQGKLNRLGACFQQLFELGNNAKRNIMQYADYADLTEPDQSAFDHLFNNLIQELMWCAHAVNRLAENETSNAEQSLNSAPALFAAIATAVNQVACTEHVDDGHRRLLIGLIRTDANFADELYQQPAEAAETDQSWYDSLSTAETIAFWIAASILTGFIAPIVYLCFKLVMFCIELVAEGWADYYRRETGVPPAPPHPAQAETEVGNHSKPAEAPSHTPEQSHVQEMVGFQRDLDSERGAEQTTGIQTGSDDERINGRENVAGNKKKSPRPHRQ